MKPATDAVVEGFRAEATAILATLSACELLVSDVDALRASLIQLRPLLLAHLEAKDAFYGRLKDRCTTEPGATTAKTFAENMRAQGDAVRRFFLALEPSASPLLTQSFRTMALIIKHRLAEEERTIYPLYLASL